ncbi:MAG: alanine--glyoxylate aminotransferase family protein [Chloroflexi bacterium]|nr:alanine--glyoxylate aminotransferase family protein [Chloroflexota bacterium]
MNERQLLMIPGPISFDPAVLRAMSIPTDSHVSAEFIDLFGQALDDMLQVFLAPHGYPFVVAGSGTLAMELGLANLVEPGDRVLVLRTGVFGERFSDIARRQGAEVDEIVAPLGEVPDMAQVEAKLASAPYKVMAVTHVDTSTGVATDVKALAALAREHGALSVVDGVCATAGMECRQEEWGVDVYLTASQKAISVPPGLALLVASERAIEAFRRRKTLVRSYYADWGKWLPIMEAYRQRKAAYFGTPAVNLVYALRVSLAQILAEGMDARFLRHRRLSDGFKAAMAALGLRQVPARSEIAATTLTAVYYPDGVGAELLGKIAAEGVVVAGGLHPDIKTRYFRVGHMGPAGPSDILATVGAIERGLGALGYPVEMGRGVEAAQRAMGI